MLHAFENVRTKIQIFGRQLLSNNNKKEDEEKVAEKSCPLMIMPDSMFKAFWNMIVAFLLIYTATYVPY